MNKKICKMNYCLCRGIQQTLWNRMEVKSRNRQEAMAQRYTVHAVVYNKRPMQEKTAMQPTTPAIMAFLTVTPWNMALNGGRRGGSGCVVRGRGVSLMRKILRGHDVSKSWNGIEAAQYWSLHHRTWPVRICELSSHDDEPHCGLTIIPVIVYIAVNNIECCARGSNPRSMLKHWHDWNYAGWEVTG